MRHAALAAALLAALGPAREGRSQSSEPLLIDSTAQRPPVTVHVVPEPRPAGPAAGDSLTVGTPLWVTVRTSGPPGYSLLPASILDAWRARPELAVLETDRRDAQLRVRIALFRPGAVALPPVTARVLTDRGDTLGVPVTADTIQVASVLAPGDTLLADIKPLWREGGVPAWVWWALAALALLALALAIRAWRRRRPAAVPAAAAVPADPYEAARERLAALRVDPPAPEPRAAAGAAIGETLRQYLADAWRASARERTTLELLAELPAAVAGERPALGAILSTADLAKYARLAPAPGEVPVLADRALAALERLEARRSPAAEPADLEAAS